MRNIKDLLNQDETTLGTLVARVQDIHLLNNTIKQILKDDFPHYHISSFDKGILTIIVYNGPDATLLRYQSSQIISKLRSYPQWAGLASVKIKVQVPPTVYKPVEPEVRQPLSEENKAQFKALADALKSEDGMQGIVEVLNRLSS